MPCSIPIVILIHIPILKPIGDGYTIFKALSLVSTTLEIEYAMQYTYSYTLLIHIPILKPIGDGYTIFKALSLVSAMLEIEYAMQYTYSSTLLTHIPILKPIGDENSEPCLWFLLYIYQ